LRLSRDLTVRSERSFFCSKEDIESYTTKKNSSKSDYWIAR